MGSLRNLKLEGALNKDEMFRLLNALDEIIYELYVFRHGTAERNASFDEGEEILDKLHKACRVLERRGVKRRFKLNEARWILETLHLIMHDLVSPRINREEMDACLDQGHAQLTVFAKLLQGVSRDRHLSRKPSGAAMWT